MKDSAMFYRSQCDALKALPAEQFKAAVLALWEYEMDDAEPKEDPIAIMAVEMAKPLIRRRQRNIENGGRNKPKPNPDVTQTEPTQNPEVAQTDPNANPNTPVKDKGERINSKETLPKGSVKKSGLQPPSPVYPYTEIINRLNEKAGTHFLDKSKDTRKHIKARFEEGFTLEDFYTVIDKMTEKWRSNPEMVDYLRPSTLFGTKFESYLNAQPAQEPKAKKVENRFNNFEQRDYDWQDIERRLLARSAAPYEQG